MREGKRYLSLFLAAAITVTGMNVGSAFQVNAANNDAATVSDLRTATLGIGSPDAESVSGGNGNVSGSDGQEANKTALNAKIAEANEKAEKDYTSASWTAFKSALDAAKDVAAKADATQTEVDTTLNDLTAAINGLREVTPGGGQEVNKTALNAKIAEANEKAEKDYTPASWTAFKSALDAAKDVAAKADATQTEVDTALNDLTAAIDKLVKVADKKALKAEIAKAAGLKQASYTAETWTKLQTALTAARGVDGNANATQAQVNSALANLTAAINSLKPVTNVDKTKLKKSIDAANKLKKAAYTSASWKTFNTALTNAKNVYNNANATQAQVDAAKKKLDDAKKALKKAVTRVTITNGKALKIAAGKEVALKATAAPKDAANKKVKWSISAKDKKYASVSSKGVVTTKKAGAGKTVTVTATAADGSKKKATVKITIMKNAVTKITLKAKSKTVKVGKKVTVKATVKTNGKKANKSLTWKSSNAKCATVNNKGVVTAKKAGTVTITATATDGSGKKGTIKIKIKK